MIHPLKPSDIINDETCQASLEIVKKYETIDGMWGIDVIKLTDEEINALKEGEYIYTEDGEYATLLCYSADNKEKKDETMA